MVTTYFIIMGILVIVSLVGGTIAVLEKTSTYYGSPDVPWKFIVAGVTAGLIVAVIWPLVLPLAIVAFIVYGLYSLPALVRFLRDEYRSSHA